MPEIRVVFYRDADGSIPTLEWLNNLPRKVRAKCIGKIRRLRSLGHKLRRPEADYLRDDIYELIPVPDLKATNSFSRISDSGDLLRISSRLIQIWYENPFRKGQIPNALLLSQRCRPDFSRHHEKDSRGPTEGNRKSN